MERYLFCTDESASDPFSPEDLFITHRTPEHLTEAQRQADLEIRRLQNRYKMPGILSFLQWLGFVVGMVIAAGIIRANVPLAQKYQNAPALFWICGGSLIVSGILFLLKKYLQHRRDNSEEALAGCKQAEDAEKAIRKYMSVPDDATKIKVLRFAYREGGDHPDFLCAALPVEMDLFRNNDGICLFDDTHVFTFPFEELAGIRVINQPIPIIDLNEPDCSGRDRLRVNGVIMEDGLPTGLRFYCALDIIRLGMTYSLPFPAYEMEAVQSLCGLTAPELPSVTDRGQEGLSVDRSQDGDKIQPLFYWKPPKEKVAFWFTRASDFEFRTKHPVLYVVFAILGIIALVLPIVLFLMIIRGIPGAVNSGWGLLGVVGGFIAGAGLFNIVAAWLHQYLGHKVTIICLLTGIVMMSVSYFLVR